MADAGGWLGTEALLRALADKTLFFVGGAPRSGTTWLQQMLDAHPDAACRGEGLFLHHFAVPLEKLLADRGEVIVGKNRELFGHTGGFPPHEAADGEHLLGTSILLSLSRFGADPACRAVGEKTPENVFFFPRLRALFPRARFIAIARDPRDVLSSAWHFFGARGDGSMEGFIRAALPSMVSGAEAMIRFADAVPEATRLVTYEALRADPRPVLADLFGLLGLRADAAVLEAIVAATSFEAATGRAAGTVAEGSFHRVGLVGAGRASLPPALNALIVEALGWSFERFGWTIA